MWEFCFAFKKIKKSEENYKVWVIFSDNISDIKILDDHGRLCEGNDKNFSTEGGEVMRIEAYNAVSQIYSAKKPGQVNKTNTSYGRDQVQISSLGKDFQTVKQAVANSSDIRSEVTEPIKAAIKNGTYNVSNDDFAAKLIEKFEGK